MKRCHRSDEAKAKTVPRSVATAVEAREAFCDPGQITLRDPWPIIGDLETNRMAGEGDREPYDCMLGRVALGILEQVHHCLREQFPVAANPQVGLN